MKDRKEILSNFITNKEAKGFVLKTEEVLSE